MLVARHAVVERQIDDCAMRIRTDESFITMAARPNGGPQSRCHYLAQRLRRILCRGAKQNPVRGLRVRGRKPKIVARLECVEARVFARSGDPHLFSMALCPNCWRPS